MAVMKKWQPQLIGASRSLRRQLAWGAGLMGLFLFVAFLINHLYLTHIHWTCQALTENLEEQNFLIRLCSQLETCKEWQEILQEGISSAQRTQAMDAWLAASKTLLDTLTEKTESSASGKTNFELSGKAWNTWYHWARQYVDGMLARWEGMLDASGGGNFGGPIQAEGSARADPHQALARLCRAAHVSRNRLQAGAQVLGKRLAVLLVRHRRWTAAWMLMALAAGCIGLLWMGKYVLGRVNVLSEAAARLAEGKQPPLLHSSSQDELAQLGAELNRLANKVLQPATGSPPQQSTAPTHRQQWSRWIARSATRLLEPLVKIQTHTEILSQKLSEPDALHTLRTIEQNARALCDMVDTCHLWGQLEAGLVKPQLRAFSLSELLGELVGDVQNLLEAKGLSLQIQWHPTPPEPFLSDPHLLKKILMHELVWAIEHTELGEIQFQVRTVLEGRPACVQVGLLCPLEVRKLEETGLASGGASSRCPPQPDAPPVETIGWHVCRELAKLLHGEIKIETSEDGSSGFVLSLPMVQPRSASPEAPPIAQPGKIPGLSSALVQFRGRVLLAEDGPENQRLISFLLRKAGLEVDIAADGKEAVQRVLQSLRASPGQPTYDLILMDMLMPVLDGFQATRQLRQAGYSGPILAITGLTDQYSSSECLEAGCNDYLAKPFEREKLIALVQKYLPTASPETSKTELTPPAVLST